MAAQEIQETTPRGGAREGAGRKRMKDRTDVQFKVHRDMFEELESLRLAVGSSGVKALPRSTWYCTIVESALDAEAELPVSPLRNGVPRRLTKICLPGPDGIELRQELRFVDLHARATARAKELGIGQMAGFVRRCLAWHLQQRAKAAVAMEIANRRDMGSEETEAA